MALNKLKKWIGTQAMTAFFDQLNDNVDATNAAIDLAEQNAANLSVSDEVNIGSGVRYRTYGKLCMVSISSYTGGSISALPSAAEYTLARLWVGAESTGFFQCQPSSSWSSIGGVSGYGYFVYFMV